MACFFKKNIEDRTEVVNFRLAILHKKRGHGHSNYSYTVCHDNSKLILC